MPYARIICCAFGSILLGSVLLSCSSPLNEQAVKEHRERARALVEKQQFREALTAYQEVVKLDPTFTDAWEKLAALYEKGGDPKKALEAFKKAKTLARQ